MALYRDEGVVLRSAKLGEADRIITLLTKGHGKVRAVAKGVRRVKSRFGGRLESFMRVDLLLAEGRSLDVVSQVESIAPYAASICSDYAAYTAANVIAETADRLVSAEHENATRQYQLLIAALGALSRHEHAPDVIGSSYVLRALGLAGWTPRLGSCVVCGCSDGLSYFSVQAGGVMCSAHRTPDARPIDAACREQLEALTNGDWHVLDAVAMHAGVAGLVEEWGEYYLEHPIRSLKLLDS